jgi:dienelactone hydrolase
LTSAAAWRVLAEAYPVPYVSDLLFRTLKLAPASASVTLDAAKVTPRDGYRQVDVSFEGDEGERVPAHLLVPDGEGPFPAFVAWHQHNSEWHLGKSEVAGIAGDPLQAFGPALAREGVAVLAPDVVTFEERRSDAACSRPADRDWVQHYNAMAHRLLRGDTLMRKVLDDALRATTGLLAWGSIDAARVGVLGHSMGGVIALFHAAVDPRLHFVALSGSLARYRRRIDEGVGIGMVEVIPGLAAELEAEDLVTALAPRPLLVASADQDRYASDADEIVEAARPVWLEAGADITSIREAGGHALTRDRFDAIVAWCAAAARR